MTKAFKNILQDFEGIAPEELQTLEIMSKEEYLAPPDYIWQSLPATAKLEYIKKKFPDLAEFIITQETTTPVAPS